MNWQQARRAVLDMDPDKPGVGRLALELLEAAPKEPLSSRMRDNRSPR